MNKQTPNFKKIFSGFPLTEKEFKKNFCGRWIGIGAHRKVYIFKLDDRFVVKVERRPREKRFTNIGEWLNWQWNKEWKQFADWLAPCEWISDDGVFLIQRRVERTMDGGSKKFPKRIPVLLTDTKYFNFGWLDGRLVCCDYPHLISADFKMKNAKWWGSKK